MGGIIQTALGPSKGPPNLVFCGDFCHFVLFFSILVNFHRFVVILVYGTGPKLPPPLT
ncbi:hypothetical protein EXN66_Car007360 [Channa argus]|uniref:Uncharacterized protein n=1 Tax=Channa argus TaxID=215402 RepID=A0A6G1PN28_CHAAH|nr:hypothetical protein EXN66_Car007360 [Channa argus]